ncbi:hypothetical protein [Marinobacter salicampi]|uniref:hypothetical protein n=1 Tax=Marinobacter salicampi TaxID=435907 RepID=UPI00140A01C1|nr:hypothetical protein [Marinobacter salicampi]
MHQRNKLGIMIATALLVTGCGGGGGSDSSSGDGSGSGTGSEPTVQDVTISGRAADGYLVQATVCADLNANGQCDAGEPTTTSGAGGAFSLDVPENQLGVEIVVQAIANLTVDEDDNQPVPKGFTLRSPINPEADKQFVSPVTTMVADEMKRSASTTLEQAKKAVSERLKTSFDPIADYVAAAKDSSNVSAQQNAERLHRIAQVTTRVMAEIENNITQSDLDQAGITMAEFLAMASRQVELLVSIIINDVDATLGNPNFDADEIVKSPDYALTPPIEDRPPSNPEPTPAGDVLSDRLATAKSASPFFTDSPSGSVAQPDASATYYEITEHPSMPDRYYYKAHERTLASGIDNSGSLAAWEMASKGPEGNVIAEIIPPDMANLKIFNGSMHREMGVPEKYLNGIDVSAEAGELFGIAFEGNIGITASYHEVDLSDLNVAQTLAAIYPSVSIQSFAEDEKTALFPAGSAAYAVYETLADPLFMTSWRGLDVDDTSTMCSPNADISVVQSCNLVYGNHDGFSDAMPATTFDMLTFPDGQAAGASGIGFEDGGQQYWMYLFGDKADGTGRIEVHHFDGGNAVFNGTWEKVDQPFEHIKLNLPDGIYYRAFLDTMGGNGYAYLFEHEGYLRAGRAVLEGTEVPAIFQRDPGTLLLNATAKNVLLGPDGMKSKFVENPGWTED